MSAVDLKRTLVPQGGPRTAKPATSSGSRIPLSIHVSTGTRMD
jgi:hypothetical protein